jgi:DNA-binding beta-propeller fold protein YncE
LSNPLASKTVLGPRTEVPGMNRRLLLPLALAGIVLTGVAGADIYEVYVTQLPSGWALSPATGGPHATTGTMPQGLALSPDGTKLAVVESGDLPPALRILNAADLSLVRTVKLHGAFGKPVWQNANTVWVAGANGDNIVAVDAGTGNVVRTIKIGKGTWPAAVALSPNHTRLAVADDGSADVNVVDLKTGELTQFPAGGHPSDVTFSADGAKLYVASRSQSVVRAITLSDGSDVSIRVAYHPSAMALSTDGKQLFVAAGDDDVVDVIDTTVDADTGVIDVHLTGPRVLGNGSLPNGLHVSGNTLYVTLGGANEVAEIVARKVVAEAPTGWYPTGVDVGTDGSLYISNGKGEGDHPNPQFNPWRHTLGYVADLAVGSVRKIAPLLPSSDNVALDNATPQWTAPPDAQTVLRPNGPIQHVIYIIKENRSYDQVLGDISQANGDASLVMFGNAITPNQHALSLRFGIFDNAYVNAQVSADGHNWTDAGIANDYVERFWPPSYGDRRDAYDFQNGVGPDVPHSGYLWDAAARAHITYRDYGEDEDASDTGHAQSGTTDHPNLKQHIDPRYVGWDLGYSDAKRFAEWKREFDGFVRDGNLPQFEIVYLPNDHTHGTSAGAPSPQAYVAQNDLAVGRLVEAISHSRYWASTAIFALEDDAQNGPDHVSDQRSTFYVASPYAKGGVQHDHYSTASVLHTMELILGLKPLTLYDDTAQPMYAAFGLTPDLTPYDAIAPSPAILRGVNKKTTYGAALSARQNWNDPDEVQPDLLNKILERDILGHTVRTR